MIVKFIWLGVILFFSLHVEVIVKLGIAIRFEYLLFQLFGLLTGQGSRAIE